METMEKATATGDTDPSESLAAAVGRIPSGLFVLTARNGDDETGMLASWVQQCSFDPPQVSVAVNKARDVLGWLSDGSAFVLNVIPGGIGKAPVAHFGKGFAPGKPAFDGLKVITRARNSACTVGSARVPGVSCRQSRGRGRSHSCDCPGNRRGCAARRQADCASAEEWVTVLRSGWRPRPQGRRVAVKSPAPPLRAGFS